MSVTSGHLSSSQKDQDITEKRLISRYQGKKQSAQFFFYMDELFNIGREKIIWGRGACTLNGIFWQAGSHGVCNCPRVWDYMLLHVMIWRSKMVQWIWEQKSKGVTRTCCPNVWIKVSTYESLIRNVFNSHI